jgi:hypothetical protein
VRPALRWRVAAALVALVAAVALLAGCGATSAPAGTSASGVTHPEIGFRSPERLDEHYRKHGREFGDVTRDEYLRIAQSLRDRPAGGAVQEAVRADSVVTRFDRADGAFVAFDPDLVIRTLFKPNDGEAYFLRQAAR